MTDAENTTTETDHSGNRRRVILVLLILLLLILLLAFCGVLYVLYAVTNVPSHKPVLANKPGVKVAFEAFGGSFGLLDHPLDAAYGNGKIYVTEPVAGKVLVFDDNGKNGKLFVQNESHLKGRGGLKLNQISVSSPEGVDVGPDGTVYIADPVKSAIVEFDPSGKKLRELPMFAPRFAPPTRVKFVNNKLYILSTGTMYVTDLQGNLLARYGTFGQGLNQLAGPAGLSVNKLGNVYIADMNNYRILALGPNFNMLWQLGHSASTEAQENARVIGAPSGITLSGADNNLYFVDGADSDIWVINQQGKQVSYTLSGPGEADDQLRLPTSIDWMSDNLFLISDQFHNRIVGFRLTPQPIGSK